MSEAKRRSIIRRDDRPRPVRRRLLLLAFACSAFVLMARLVSGRLCRRKTLDPPAVCDPDAGQACSAAVNSCKKRKNGLQNIYHNWIFNTKIGDLEAWNYRVWTDWGYRTNALGCYPYHVIRWRRSTPLFTPRAAVGTATDGGRAWHTSYCYDAGRQCLTRLQATGLYSATIEGEYINAIRTVCIATRIGPGGDHNRVVHTKGCDEVTAASSAKSARAVATLEQRVDRENATIEDFVSREVARRIHRMCGRGLDTPCRKALRGAWRSLSADERRRAASLMEKSGRRAGPR